MDQARAGAFIAALRKVAGMTQAQLGERLGVTNKTVSRWECGNYMPDLDTCLALSELFGVTINELLMGQRLSDGEMRQTANQVLTEALHREAFSLAERTRYWKRKWRREHGAFIVLLALGWLLLLAAVYVLLDGLGDRRPLAGGLVCLLGVCLYGWQRNRMMGYVEDKLYGKMSEREEAQP